MDITVVVVVLLKIKINLYLNRIQIRILSPAVGAKQGISLRRTSVSKTGSLLGEE